MKMGLKSIALIGCGAAALKYYVPALIKHQKKFKKIYFVDVHLEQAKSIATLFDVYETANDYREIVDEVDGAIIAVPHQYHYEIAKFFLEHSKHVLCEKPLVEKPNEAEDIIKIAAKNNVHICVNNTRRMFPIFQKIKEIIDSHKDDLVEIIYVEANKFAWESKTNFYVNPQLGPKGVLLDLGSHVLDLVCWWLEGKPVLTNYEDDSFGGPESFSLINASFDKVNIRILLNRLVDIGNLIHIKFKDFSILANMSNWKQIVYVSSNGKEKSKSISTDFKKYSDMVNAIILNFFEVVYGSENPLIGAADVYNSIDWIDECYRNRKRAQFSWNETVESIIDEK